MTNTKKLHRLIEREVVALVEKETAEYKRDIENLQIELEAARSDNISMRARIAELTGV
jgi:hypothetical protein